MLTLYGTRQSRAFRCLWMLEEAGVDYRLEAVDFAKGEARNPAFLRINPNGKVPALVDGELTLFESLAINLHLARCYAADLWPLHPNGESRLFQWTIWAMGELEGPHDAANRSNTDLDADALHTSLDALRATLLDQDYLLENRFTVADLNTASVLLRPKIRPFAARDKQLGDWFRRCTSRPALARAVAQSPH
jgi:glutathione S-transferase